MRWTAGSPRSTRAKQLVIRGRSRGSGPSCASPCACSTGSRCASAARSRTPVCSSSRSSTTQSAATGTSRRAICVSPARSDGALSRACDASARRARRTFAPPSASSRGSRARSRATVHVVEGDDGARPLAGDHDRRDRPGDVDDAAVLPRERLALARGRARLADGLRSSGSRRRARRSVGPAGTQASWSGEPVSSASLNPSRSSAGGDMAVTRPLTSVATIATPRASNSGGSRDASIAIRVSRRSTRR